MSATLSPLEQRHELVFPLQAEWRDSGDPDRPDETTLRGHAAVWNSPSGDLGGFRELLEPHAFRDALRRSDARLLLNHDPHYVLARQASGTLELREDTEGLHVFARVDKGISWVNDLRRSMQRSDIDQMSFAFTLREGGDDWAVAEDGTVVRTIRADGIQDLYDVSVVTYPAYEATSVNMRSVLDAAVAAGKLPESLRGSHTIETESGGAGIAARGADDAWKRAHALAVRAARKRI